jgi:hypothetical protein
MKRDEYLFIGLVYVLIIGIGLAWPAVKKDLPVRLDKAHPGPSFVRLFPANKSPGSLPHPSRMLAAEGTRGTPVDWRAPLPAGQPHRVLLAHGVVPNLKAKAGPASIQPAGPKKGGTIEKFPVS